jgi:geranylgeranyl diphosphate synthase type II
MRPLAKLQGVALQSQLKTYAEWVDKRLDFLLPALGEEPALLHEAMRYSVLAPGKRIRPALVLACCEAVGGSAEDALDAACAVELVHCFSLIHDDLPALDNDELRRGRPTCHVKFGEAVAVLAGDGLFALAFDALAYSHAPAEHRVRAIGILTRATGMLVSGETIDILSEGKIVSENTLRMIHERKTAALIAASCEMGAVLGGGSEDEIVHLKRFGFGVGLAFQIADDVLNETSSPEQLGKAAGSDRERGKATYPSLYGLEASRQAALDAAQGGLDQLEGFDSPFLRDIAMYTVERLH